MSTVTQPDASGFVLCQQKTDHVCKSHVLQELFYIMSTWVEDQSCAYYSCHTFSFPKFYRCVLYILFDVAMTNSFIAHKYYASNPTHNKLSWLQSRPYSVKDSYSVSDAAYNEMAQLCKSLYCPRNSNVKALTVEETQCQAIW